MEDKWIWDGEFVKIKSGCLRLPEILQIHPPPNIIFFIEVYPNRYIKNNPVSFQP